MVATTLTAQADKPFELNLWQGKPKVKSSDPNDTAKVYVYLPNKKQATRRAVVTSTGLALTVPPIISIAAIAVSNRFIFP